MKSKLEVKCPHCKKTFEYYQSSSRPFCCARCKAIDLGKWAAEEFRVKSNTPLSEEDIDIVVSSLEGEEIYE